MLGRALCVGLLTTLAGCGTGLIYTHVTTPLDLDFNNTPVVRAGAEGNVKTLQFRVRFEWGSRGIGEIAKERETRQNAAARPDKNRPLIFI